MPFHVFQKHIGPEQIGRVGIDDAPPQAVVVVVVPGQQIQALPGLDHVLDDPGGRADGTRPDALENRFAVRCRIKQTGLGVA